jgi:Family of unknown function (DUF6159)
MRRIANSVAMAGASWRVLQSDKQLMVIPVMSFACTLAVALLSGGAVWFSLHQVIEADGSTGVGPTPLTWVVGAVAYLLITFVVTFFTAALVAGARERLMTGTSSLGSAFSATSRRLPEIALWALLVGTVGLILQALENRAGIVIRLLLRGLGMSWRIATWLAIPVIVAEGTGPITSLKRSAGLFRQTWGENLVGQFGFGLVGLLAIVPGLVIAGLLMVNLPLVGIVVGFVWVASVSVVISTMTGIFRTVLYQYASGGALPPEFDHGMLGSAFASRQGRVGARA